MSEYIDFDTLDAQLLPRAEELIQTWLPNARRLGSEIRVGNVRGDPGESLRFNLAKGYWKDWATDEGGPGLVSLYAGIRGIDPPRAARELLGHIQPEAVRSPTTGNARNKSHFVGTDPRHQDTLDRPPTEAVKGFNGTHRSLGKPTNLYWYRDAHGPLFVVCRYELVGEEKQFVPWRWNAEGKRWYQKAAPKPWPLYRLERLLANPQRPVLIVEGEKCVEAAEQMFPDQIVTT